MVQRTAPQQTESQATGGILGLVLSGVGIVLTAGSVAFMFVTATAAITLVAGVLLVIGGAILYRLTLNGNQQERDMTELMELLTDLN